MWSKGYKSFLVILLSFFITRMLRIDGRKEKSFRRESYKYNKITSKIYMFNYIGVSQVWALGEIYCFFLYFLVSFY